jgi:hypothetical protein
MATDMSTDAPTSASSAEAVMFMYAAPTVDSIGLVRAHAPSTVNVVSAGSVVSTDSVLLLHAEAPSESAPTKATRSIFFLIVFILCLVG